ncbi:MAG: hypothetical protein IJ347_07365 [Faecalibacterium sp.]|nr:hypothetical protein [Faecalibacterium sp.]
MLMVNSPLSVLFFSGLAMAGRFVVDGLTHHRIPVYYTNSLFTLQEQIAFVTKSELFGRFFVDAAQKMGVCFVQTPMRE